MTSEAFSLDIALPWPQGWEQVQWEVAAWVAEHGDRARVQVVWNETRLYSEVDAAKFQAETTPFFQALKDRLGEGLRWQFDQLSASTQHRLVLGRADR